MENLMPSDAASSNVIRPPESVMKKSMGVADFELYVESGDRSLTELERFLAGLGMSLTDFDNAIDIGSEAGRLAQHLCAKYPALAYLGIDIDEESVNFCRSLNITGARFETVIADNMEVESELFDFCYSHSVITHLDKHHVNEFFRFATDKLKPHGIFVFSFNGKYSFKKDLENIVAHGGSLLEQLYRTELLASQGYLYIDKSYDAQIGLPEFYQNTFHRFDYLEALISNRFDILAYYPRADLGWQDVIVAQRK